MIEYNSHTMRDVMQAAIRIIRGGNVHEYNPTLRMWEWRDIQGRDWFRDLDNRYAIHGAVWDAVKLCRPRDWQQLVLEYPHKADTDVNRIAYTRDERAGVDNRQTLTTIGKYLMRHFDLPDHEIRDIVARYTSKGVMYFVHTVAEMVHAVNHGPNSCMKWSSNRGVRCVDGVDRHPYACYDPKYGWHMAIRKDGDEIVGRALCVSNDHGKYFVRSFKKGDSYSYSDEMLEAWLKGQGYTHESGYPTEQKLARYDVCDGGFLAPYIDGDMQDVSAYSGHLEIEERGEFTCNETQGHISDGNNECEDCGSREHEDDMYTVGRYEDRRVCHCCRENYREAISRSGYTYTLHEDDCVYVESQDAYYHTDYLNSNNIIELENGEYEHEDNCVEVNDDWYHVDDERLVIDYDGVHQLRENCVELVDGSFALEDECWECAGSGGWYRTDDVDPITVDGEVYHPDHVPTHSDTN